MAHRAMGLVLAAAAVFGPLPATAQVFKDKTITMVINYAAGGNADTEGRIFQRHLPKHLAGSPTIIVQNLPGSGGLTAVNQLGLGVGIKEPALTFGFFTFNAIAPLIDDPALKVKVETMPMIASVGQWYVAYGRKDALPGQQRPADIAKAKGIFAAGYARSSNHDIRLRLMLDLMGTDYKVVTGFQSVSAVNLAIERSEISFMLSTTPGYETQVVPNLIEKGIAIPLWQLAGIGPDGKFQGSPDLEKQGIKYFEEVYKDATGKAPSGAIYDALLLTNESSSKLARAVMMAPGVPAENLAELRRAFVALAKDRDFIAEYKNIIKMDPIMFSGEEADASLKKAITNVPAPVKAVLKSAAGVDDLLSR